LASRARVVVVGGGVAGLTAAYRLVGSEPAPEVTVLEAGAHAGGRLATAEVGGLELDAGPDSLVARKPWAVELCRDLGIELIEPGSRGAFAWTARGLVPLPTSALGIPADLDELARWPGLSRAGRARAITDLVRRARPPVGDESLGSLLRRRLGDEATDRLVAPLLGGLFAGDVDRLGVRATFPELAGWERDFGSLIRGAKAALRPAAETGPMFLRPADGVSALPDALSERLGPERLRAGAPATTIVADGAGYLVRTAAGDLHADAVVVATPSYLTAELLGALAPPSLREIPYVGTSVVLLVYPEGTADALPDATGFVVPAGAAPMTAATFISRKWPDPACGDRAVVRSFVGAAGTEDVLDASDDDIVQAVCRHLAAVLPLPDRAEAARVVRWPGSMPQYEVGHLDRVLAIEEALPPGIFVAGNAYRGVGVADAVRSANEAAKAALAHLAGRPIGTERRG
jgi:protoporphyrinogen/coproporphyrinogen III oxidase